MGKRPTLYGQLVLQRQDSAERIVFLSNGAGTTKSCQANKDRKKERKEKKQINKKT